MTPRSLRVPANILAEIVAHAQAAAPHEACGLLRGRDGVVTALTRGVNEAAQPATRYQLDATTLLQQLDWEARGEALLAIYHSHPTTAAWPSPLDAAWASYPDAVIVICSLAGPAPVVRGYRLERRSLPARPPDVQPTPGEAALWAAPLTNGYAFVQHRADGEEWFGVEVLETQLETLEATWQTDASVLE